MYYEEIPNPQVLLTKKRKKQQQATMLIALVLIGGLAYYFLGHLPEEKSRVKQEIEDAFKENFKVLPENLDKSLWEEKETWQTYLDSLFLPSQVKAFGEKMLKAIERKSEEIEQEEKDRPRKLREEAIDNIKSACEEGELEMPKIQEIIEKSTEKINKAPLQELDKIKKQAKNLIEQERFKRQKLH